MSNFLAQVGIDTAAVDAGAGMNTALDPSTMAAIGAGIWLVLIVLIVWSFIWKGIALWKAARNGSKVWYVVLLLVNTCGILEIIYIFAVAKKTEVTQSNPPGLGEAGTPPAPMP